MLTFPDNFLWGTATASYQIEGAYDKGGRVLSIWDAFSKTPGKTFEGDTGDVACDHYHRFKEDVALMKDMGLKAYRFSVAWPRICPSVTGEANPEGIAFYNALIDALLEADIQPWVTLYHWDLPLSLQTEHDGWLNPSIADHFGHYARLCFDAFGDRVKHWITLNEPWCSAFLGYGNGMHAPGRVSPDEPYVAAHSLLLSHGTAVKIYREEFQAKQGGVIGITNNCDFREPKTDSADDKAAAQRSMEFFLGWFADPVYFGDYPTVMRERLGDRLPTFTNEEKAMLKGSSDFFGLNHYGTALAAEPSGDAALGKVAGNGGFDDDQGVDLSEDPNWEKTDMGWNIVPWGCRKLIEWITERYDAPDIYITENGCAMPEPDKETAINDTRRRDFLKGYISECHAAIANGVNLKGYFCWSFMDNFEWSFGYSKRFGIHYVDYETQKRTPKLSAKWYTQVIADNGISN